jgi:ribonuclease P protein component
VAGRPSGGRSPKRRRLSRSAEFERVYRQGRSKSNRFLVLYAFPRGEDDPEQGPRLGLSVSRRVGGAVDRSRVKRALREAFWAETGRLPEGSDYVVVARPDARELAQREGTAGVRTALAELVDRLGGVEGGDGGESAEPDERSLPSGPEDEPAESDRKTTQ